MMPCGSFMGWRDNMRFPFVFIIMLGFGCSSDINLKGIEKYTPPAEDTSAAPEENVEIEEPEIIEECLDRIHSSIQLALQEDCKIEPPIVQYTPVIEWVMEEFDEFPLITTAVTIPVVGQFTDDNTDGIVDSNDIPDMVVVMTPAANSGERATIMRMISGDGSTVHWSRHTTIIEDITYEFIVGGVPALGDIDNDGEAEIVVALAPINTDAGILNGPGHSGQLNCLVAVFDAQGNLEMTNTTNKIQCRGHSPFLGDVNSDGQPDIVIERQTFIGNTLELLTNDDNLAYRGQSRSESYWNGSIVVTSDLDGDGYMEYVSGRHIHEWDGTLRCLTGDIDGYTAVADINQDGYGEIVVTGHGTVVVYDRNCTMLHAWQNEDGGRGGPPTIADYDGDGQPEIGFPSRNVYAVYEVDGTLQWTTPAVDNSSNCTGSSVFDFEGDGYAEVVYADEVNLWIISGYNGSFVMRESYHDSGTANEYPIVVDVDNDGEAEIVVGHNKGIYVVSALEGWEPTRTVWNQHAYHITNINDDMSIPSPTQSNWPQYNSFRSNDLRENNGQGAQLVDAIPLEMELCEIECAQDKVRVVVGAGNQGLADAINGVNFALYTEIEGQRQLLRTHTAQYPLRKGYSTEGFVFDVALSEIPERNIIVVADDDGTGQGLIEECNENNNEIRFAQLCGE